MEKGSKRTVSGSATESICSFISQTPSCLPILWGILVTNVGTSSGTSPELNYSPKHSTVKKRHRNTRQEPITRDSSSESETELYQDHVNCISCDLFTCRGISTSIELHISKRICKKIQRNKFIDLEVLIPHVNNFHDKGYFQLELQPLTFNIKILYPNPKKKSKCCRLLCQFLCGCIIWRETIHW